MIIEKPFLPRLPSLSSDQEGAAWYDDILQAYRDIANLGADHDEFVLGKSGAEIGFHGSHHRSRTEFDSWSKPQAVDSEQGRLRSISSPLSSSGSLGGVDRTERHEEGRGSEVKSRGERSRSAFTPLPPMPLHPSSPLQPEDSDRQIQPQVRRPQVEAMGTSALWMPLSSEADPVSRATLTEEYPDLSAEPAAFSPHEISYQPQFSPGQAFAPGHDHAVYPSESVSGTIGQAKTAPEDGSVQLPAPVTAACESTSSTAATSRPMVWRQRLRACAPPSGPASTTPESQQGELDPGPADWVGKSDTQGRAEGAADLAPSTTSSADSALNQHYGVDYAGTTAKGFSSWSLGGWSPVGPDAESFAASRPSDDVNTSDDESGSSAGFKKMSLDGGRTETAVNKYGMRIRYDRDRPRFSSEEEELSLRSPTEASLVRSVRRRVKSLGDSLKRTG